jgi:hypothetical protein
MKTKLHPVLQAAYKNTHACLVDGDGYETIRRLVTAYNTVDVLLAFWKDPACEYGHDFLVIKGEDFICEADETILAHRLTGIVMENKAQAEFLQYRLPAAAALQGTPMSGLH